MIRRSTTTVLALMFCVLQSDRALAQVPGLEKLVMPGRVVESHQEVEGDCAACHDTQSDQLQASLCVACHEDVGADRDAQQGFHGLFPPARQSECVVCHTDHEGRDADIVNLAGGLFDHDFSDFPLSGSHLAVTCDGCHSSGDRYWDAGESCIACHVADDVHDGSLGEECADCHSDSTWGETEFDHDTVGYRLSGKHSAVECADCHRGNVFDGTPTQCASCHAVDDVHGGSNGPACQDCHATSTWKTIGFDHGLETGFALDGGHGGLNCQDCHTREDFKDGLVDDCVSCHLADDDHQGFNGTVCESCHVASAWSESMFDHAETRFSLHDSHAELHCAACHKSDVEAALPLTCGGCHVLDDSHVGQLGEECGDCHAETAWHASVAFDHDLSGYPLTGLHATVACAGCHESNRFKDAPSDCISCHTDDDAHKGSLGEECGACHTSNDWASASFDHDLQTTFPLDGAHAGIGCSDCHRDSAADISTVPSTCGGCHATDDAHTGQFGTQCGDCHNSTSFSDVDRL